MNRLKSFSRLEIKKIAEEYANSCYTRSYFCEKYNISPSTFYNILDKAIVEHIVSFNTAINMKKRAIANKRERLKSNKGIKSTTEHYNKLLESRNNFIFNKMVRLSILKEFSERDIRESKTEFCINHVFDIELLEKIFIFSIIHNELPNKIYLKIKENSLIAISDTNSVNNFFNLLEKLKEEVMSGKTFEVHELYNKVYNLLNPKKDIYYENDENVKSTNFLNDNGDIVDDGYSIIDD